MVVHQFKTAFFNRSIDSQEVDKHPTMHLQALSVEETLPVEHVVSPKEMLLLEQMQRFKELQKSALHLNGFIQSGCFHVYFLYRGYWFKVLRVQAKNSETYQVTYVNFNGQERSDMHLANEGFKVYARLSTF
jgi:hypothetical protein